MAKRNLHKCAQQEKKIFSVSETLQKIWKTSYPLASLEANYWLV